MLAAGPVGLMQAAMDVALPYAAQRKQFGKPIGEFQLVQGKLADMYTRMRSSQAYVYKVRPVVIGCRSIYDALRMWRVGTPAGPL